MKKALNFITLGLVITGIFFKLEHWPGANIILILSAFSLVLTTVIYALKDNKENGVNDIINYLLIGFLLFIIAGAIFKIMHWPGGNELASVGYVLSAIVPLVLIIYSGELKVSKQYFITFLLSFLLVITFMRSNPFIQFLGSIPEKSMNDTAIKAPDPHQ